MSEGQWGAAIAVGVFGFFIIVISSMDDELSKTRLRLAALLFGALLLVPVFLMLVMVLIGGGK